MILSENQIGRTIAGYLLTLQLSSQSYYHTYLGEKKIDNKQSQRAVVSYFHARPLSSSEHQQQFLREAQQLKALQHPSILPIIDYGIEDASSIPYIITDFASFRSLYNRLVCQSPRPFFLEEALVIIIHIGKALQYTHEHNIVHGDLTPHNILFNASNQALLAGFGLPALQEDAPLEHSLYHAPEKQSSSTTVSIDIYALASIFITMLMGKQSSASSDSHISHSKAVPIPPSLPPHISSAIARARATELEQRFETVKQFLVALQMPTDEHEQPQLAHNIFGRNEQLAGEEDAPNTHTFETLLAALRVPTSEHEQPQLAHSISREEDAVPSIHTFETLLAALRMPVSESEQPQLAHSISREDEPPAEEEDAMLGSDTANPQDKDARIMERRQSQRDL